MGPSLKSLCLVILCFALDGVNSSNLAEQVSRQLQLRLQSLVNSTLQIEALENIYETKTRVEKREYNPRIALSYIVGNISERLEGVVNILHRNKAYIENNYGNQTNLSNKPLKDLCCAVSDSSLHFDARFGLVKDYESCFSNQNDIGEFSDIDDFYQENLDDSVIILWQYFGDAFGNYHQFPWKPRFCSHQHSTDHRFQNWFVYTASPWKKNVVIVVDESGSMSFPIGGPSKPHSTLRVDVAKAAARTVLDTLSPTDHVGVVAFSDEARSPSGCLGNKVARATAENKNILHKFLQTIKPKNVTHYSKALRAAFKLLTEAKHETPEEFEDSLDMILFLTDGNPTENDMDSILKEIVKGQNAMNHSVQMFVYGFGNGILSSVNKSKTEILLKIADQNNQKISSIFGLKGGNNLKWKTLPGMVDSLTPVGPVGNLTILPDTDTDQLQRVMGSYYSKFPMSTHTQYRVGHPHVEADTGLVLTLGIPTLDNLGNFFGVAAVDVSVELMFYEVVNFKLGQHSYAFVVDDKGKILVHPFMSTPSRQIRPPKFYDIRQIESVLSYEAVHNITHGLPGNFQTRIVSVWRKAVTSPGIKPATYHYHPVHGFHANYTVVMVIFDEDIEELKADEDIEKGEFPGFIYHRMDFYDNDTLGTSDLCSREDVFVLQNNATVKFAPGVYTNPVKGVEYEQNSNKSYPFYQHFKNARLFSMGADIRQSASNDVVLSNITDQLWKKDDTIWRYLGTENGFFKIFPGTMLSDIHYDPRNDLWYKKASNDPDKYFFLSTSSGQNSTEYVTMAKVFHQTSNGSVSGVAAADISKQQFSTILRNLLTSCLNCYVLDDTGSIITRSQSIPNVEGKHITAVAYYVGYLLMQKQYLKSSVCMDSTTGEKRLTYSLDLGGQGSDVRNTGCHDYLLAAINGTNLYLMIFEPDNCPSMMGRCICHDKCWFCNDQMDTVCQCPCTCINRTIDDCSSNFTLAQGYEPCQNRKNHWTAVKTLNLQLSNVSHCKPQCPGFKDESSCVVVPGCVWCTRGMYKYIPLCTNSCPQDSIEITLKAPCQNLTKYNPHDLVVATLSAVQKSIQDANADVSMPYIVDEDLIHLNISTIDGTSIPSTWSGLLSNPIITNGSEGVVLVRADNLEEGNRLQISLTFSNVNFTAELDSELTLRQYIEQQVQDLITLEFSSNVTVSDIWPEQNLISFIIKVSPGFSKSSLHNQVQSWNVTKLPQFDLFGRNLDLIDVSATNTSSLICSQYCHVILSREECNNVPGCHWDIYSQGICTNNTILPERVEKTIYLPCLGLYNNVTLAKDDIVKDVKKRLSTHINLQDSQLVHDFRFEKDHQYTGWQIDFTIQDRVIPPSLGDVLVSLDQIFDDVGKSSVNSEYTMVQHPVSYQQFTNMHITLVLEGFDSATFLHQHPLDGRSEVQHGITVMIKSFLRPQVVDTVRNFKLGKDVVTFSVDKSLDRNADLRTEYDMLQTEVTKGKVKVKFFKHRFLVKDVFFIGSFDQICPRNCSQGAQSTCDSIPGCDWSDSGQCLSEVVYPESKKLLITFSCVNLTGFDDFEKKHILTETEKMVNNFWGQQGQSNVVTGSEVQSDIDNSILVTLQATSQSPPLSVIYSDTEAWLTNNSLQIQVNGTQITGVSGHDYTSVSVAIEYSGINFTREPMEKRQELLKEIIDRIKLVLSNGIVIGKEWTTMSFVLFELSKQNESRSLTLDNEVEKIKTFISLGGLHIHMHNYSIEPSTVHTNGSVDCLQCNHSNSQCMMGIKCFLDGRWSSDICTNVSYPDRFTYEVYFPCNQTQFLSSDQLNDTEEVLQHRVLQILQPIDNSVITKVKITQSEALIELQSTPLDPYLEKYAEMLTREIDYRQRFSVGPPNSTHKLVPRMKDDYTDVNIDLVFKSIDFDAIVNSGLARREDITSTFLNELNKCIGNEIVSSFQIHKIQKDHIKLSLKKSASSHVDMSVEINKLEDYVKRGAFLLDINYIRPVIATDILIQGSFHELCKSLPGLNGQNTLPTMTSNVSVPKVPIAMIPVPTVLVLYNRSMASKKQLLTVIDTMYVDVCFLEVQQEPVCVEDISLKTCSFKKSFNKDPSVDPDHIGPVQWTIIGVSAIFLLALAIMAMQGIYNAANKESQCNQDPSNSIEDTE